MSDADETDPYAPRPVERWYTFAALASVLFMGLGCAVYLMRVFTDPATLPPDQRNALLAEPAWLTALFAIAVWGGLIGAILLLVRRRLAVAAMLVSLIATALWFAGMLAVEKVRSSLSINDWVVAIVVLALTWTIYWFANHSRRRGWLI